MLIFQIKSQCYESNFPGQKLFHRKGFFEWKETFFKLNRIQRNFKLRVKVFPLISFSQKNPILKTNSIFTGMVYILSGVSGVGKTTIGLLLSARLELPFYDADDFHPRENVEKMAAGIPLQDEDRHSWLETLAQNIKKWNEAGGAVLACSALKEIYRRQLQSIPEKELQWIFLHSEYEVILERVSGRRGHYFKPSLLQSQYETLEQPEYGLHINVNKPEENILEEIIRKVESTSAEIGLFGLGVMGKSLALTWQQKEFM
jgi:6-phosphogluconate dehydrogenase